MVFYCADNEYRWRNSRGMETTLQQDQGLDLLILQKNKSGQKAISFYSDPGTALFAALLNFHLVNHGSLPPEDEIQTVPLEDGRLAYNNLEYRLPEEPLDDLPFRHWLDQSIPQLRAGKLTLAETEWSQEVGLNLFAYGDKNQLVVARSSKLPANTKSAHKKKTFPIGIMIGDTWVNCYERDVVWEGMIRFSAEDTLDALRGIYGLTSGRSLRMMNGLYQIAHTKLA